MEKERVGKWVQGKEVGRVKKIVGWEEWEVGKNGRLGRKDRRERGRDILAMKPLQNGNEAIGIRTSSSTGSLYKGICK